MPCSGLSFPMSFLLMVRLVLGSNPDIKDWLYGGERVSQTGPSEHSSVSPVPCDDPACHFSFQKLTIVAIGCAERAEEHILRHTNYWQELSNMMPS